MPAAQSGVSRRYCIAGLNGVGQGVYYYYCKWCPDAYPPPPGMALSENVPGNKMGCNTGNDQYCGYTASWAPAPSKSLPPVPSKQLPSAQPMGATAGAAPPILNVVEYRGGVERTGFGVLPNPTFMIDPEPGVSTVTPEGTCRIDVGGGRQFGVKLFRISNLVDPQEFLVGQQVNAAPRTWPLARFIPVAGASIRVASPFNGLPYDVILG